MKLSTFNLLSIAALFTYALCAQRFSIISPSQLSSQFDEDGIPFSIGNYGRIPYGAHFVGGLALASPMDGCSVITNFMVGEDLALDQNIIAIVRKGGCSNIAKIRNAQLAGAKFVVIVQDDDNIAATTNFGTGAETMGIHIPTIFISKTDGDNLIEFLKKLPFPPLNPEDIVPIASINFPFDPIGDKVKLDFWLSSSDTATYKFLTDFASYVSSSEQSFEFTPHFVTWECYSCREVGFQLPASDDCVSGGRYCAPDPDNFGALQGKDVLFENIRQACLADVGLFWRYIPLYVERCSNTEDLGYCSSQIINSIANDVERDQLNMCFDHSFYKSDSNSQEQIDKSLDDNSILADDKELQLEYGIVEFPVLLMNHKPYSKGLNNAETVAKAACKYLKEPKGYCRSLNKNVEVHLENNSKSEGQVGTVLLLVLILSISALVIFFFFRRMQKRKLAMEISMQANNMVSAYMAIGSEMNGKSVHEQTDICGGYIGLDVKWFYKE